MVYLAFQKYRLGIQSGKDMGEALKEGRNYQTLMIDYINY